MVAAQYMVGDRELGEDTLNRCRLGDPAAMRAFVKSYERAVFAFLSRALGPGHHVEDLAQEVFIRAFRAMPGFEVRGKARPSTWLLTIASRVAIDHRRKRGAQAGELDAERTGAPDTPETERRRNEIGRALEQAAASLPDAQRDVFVLAEFHDLDQKEIAAVLGIPANTVKTRLFRARERLRELLRDVWEEGR
ncbi:MAG: sigma-70 family RNA polymerase sigma factor [Myxococcales bacterium]|nr:sigma-70 family RNA polymerase sigma factor [Myxococcales bacterium]